MMARHYLRHYETIDNPHPAIDTGCTQADSLLNGKSKCRECPFPFCIEDIKSTGQRMHYVTQYKKDHKPELAKC
jgi:hypothetical protein